MAGDLPQPTACDMQAGQRLFLGGVMGRRPRRLDRRFCCPPERRESDQGATTPGASDSIFFLCLGCSSRLFGSVVDIKPAPNTPLDQGQLVREDGCLMTSCMLSTNKDRPVERERTKSKSRPWPFACHPAPLLVLQGPSDDLSSETVALPPTSRTRTGKGKWQMADVAGLVRAGGARREISSRQSARPLAGVSSSWFGRRLDVASSSRDCHGMNSHVGTLGLWQARSCCPGRDRCCCFLKQDVKRRAPIQKPGLQGTNIILLDLIHTLFWYRQRFFFC